MHGGGAISEITTEAIIDITSESTTTTIDKENKNCHYSGSENKKLEIDKNLSAIAKKFEQSGFETINIKVKELLEELLEEHPIEWIIQAFKVAIEANVRNLRFVKGVLRNWQNNGGVDIGGGSISKYTDRENGSIGQDPTGDFQR
ncbi:DnaD/DnaB domain-containing replication protein [Gottschalkia acidurici 9a]|uniref:DnaD/DnaB domain-containing replication protein n=1 Tax=Gottschalkia acidurici (strain ATCC 7906 / DSM 604 / BCRC 14475 / CIP 104303 / KCTC 5404 / NCIMB 10678 / 9a) TaxID=1128398 RepID=K0AZ00_GOTA9|nr:DnaD domain protein [Gottschalkia acidurici]AFS78484.1 DnaD/DnaB domain-containing replication protein [Gottschalkia acidurici 9a]